MQASRQWGTGWLAVCLVMLARLAVASAEEPTIAAKVNGDTITLAEIDAIIKHRPQSLTPLTPSQMRQLRLEVARNLIDDRLLRQFLAQNAPEPDATTIAQHFKALAKAQQAQGKTLAEFYRDTHQTEAEVRDNIRTMLQLVGYAESQMTEQTLKSYYQAHKDYFDKVTVRASHIVLRISPHASPQQRQAAREKLEKLRGEILTEKLAFAAAAKQHSHCPSAAKGGDLGFFTRKWMVDEAIAAAAFPLQVGEISEVVETEFGLHLLQVTERTSPVPSSFVLAKEDVRDCMLEEIRQELMTKLHKSANITIMLP